MSFLKKAITPKAAGSSSTSESGNNNAGVITSAYSPTIATGNGATNFLAQMLGVSPAGVATTAGNIQNGANSIANAAGVGDASTGYNNYLQQAGYAPAMTQLSKDITGQKAAAGALNSGSYAKSLLTQGGNLNNSFYNNYLQQLSGLAGIGQNAGGLVSNAGQFSKSTGTSTGGGPSGFDNAVGAIGKTAKLAGSIASIFSDRRLKRDIELVHREADGLGVYAFRYVMNAKRVLGVMADEVARLRPWAIGPQVAGYATVNYGAL